ncbi:leucine-rich repeat-containing protein 45-like isoform X2 [Bacillus rossius redtenbacheri]|uniref:leucine-rich repeat-containing protein 45-like isoform X2 n=1 Tax=Bacillus rossius redtenbacheri TaxID=93214 RepID=UPI002FDE071E
MIFELKSYLKFCQDAKISPNEDVVSSLKTAGKTGDFILTKRTLSNKTWDIIGKMLSASENIRKVDFSDCLIPFEGTASLLGHLSFNNSVDTLILKGNNIQAENVSCLGTLLKNNSTVKMLCLEWNSLGLHPVFFSVFCDGLALNRTLEHLDLRNNELKPNVAEDLSRALARNRSLRYLDIRWNRICTVGGSLMLDAMKCNHSIIKLKLQGNYITSDVLNAVDECTQRNLYHENGDDLPSEAAASAKAKSCTQPLDPARGFEKDQDKIGPTQVFNATVLRSPDRGDHSKSQPVQPRGSKLDQVEGMLSERAAAISALQSQLRAAEGELAAARRAASELEARESASRAALEAKDKELEDLRRAADEAERGRADAESKLGSARERASASEQQLRAREGELDQLRAELHRLRDNLEAAQKQYDDKLIEEKTMNFDLLTKTEQEYQLKMRRLSNEFASFKNGARERAAGLQAQLDAAERARSDLAAQLAQETSRRNEELQQALSKLALAEERAQSLQSEKSLLERQLAMAQCTAAQLEKQNAALLSELAEPQRKLSQLHEELAGERAARQRLAQDLAEARGREQEHRREGERLQQALEVLQRQMKDILGLQEERDRSKEREAERLRALVAAKDREMAAVRAEELERVGHLYSAFTKYLGSLNPAFTLSQVTMTT